MYNFYKVVYLKARFKSLKNTVHNYSGSEKRKNKRKTFAWVLSTFSVLLVICTVVGILLIRKYFSDTDQIKNYINQHYFEGSLIMIGVTAIQVVIAFVPGELVEIAAGYAFGTIPGLFLVLLGNVIGSVIAILLTKKFGIKIINLFYPDEDINSLPILNNPKRRNLLTFLLFLIPGTPKDMLTYVIGLTDMKIWQYLLLTTFAKIPSIVSSTAGGHAFGSNKIMLAIYIFAGIGIVSIIGLTVYNGMKENKK